MFGFISFLHVVQAPGKSCWLRPFDSCCARLMVFCARFAHDFCTILIKIWCQSPVVLLSDHLPDNMKSATNHQKPLQQAIGHLFVLRMKAQVYVECTEGQTTLAHVTFWNHGGDAFEKSHKTSHDSASTGPRGSSWHQALSEVACHPETIGPFLAWRGNASAHIYD